MSNKVITTVCGNITPDQLGCTDMHDHMLLDVSSNQKGVLSSLPPCPEERKELCPENYYFARNNVFYYDRIWKIDDPEDVRPSLVDFRKNGGQSILEASASDIRGDIREVKRLSEETGVNVICCSGLYHLGTRPQKFIEMSEDEIYKFIMAEVKDGIDGTGIRPGMIKSALEVEGEDGKRHPEEIKALRACARAARDSGLSITIHTSVVPTPELLDIVNMLIWEIGLKPDRILINHTDYAACITSLVEYVNERASREPRYDRIQALLALGVNVAFDTCNNVLMRDSLFFHADDMDRLRLIMHFVKAGYADKIVLGQDIFATILGTQCGWTGYSRILTYIMPMLRECGCDESAIHKIFFENPARILSHEL